MTERALFDGPFFFLRHGESEANLASLIAGSTDTPLTETGRAQAAAAAERVRGLGIAAVYTSTLARAAETAMPIAAALGLPVRHLEGLCERNWGEWELRPLSWIRDRTITAPGGESLADYEDRVWRTCAGLHGPAPALIVAHSGTIRVLRKRLGIGDVYGWVGNGVPVRFEPPPGGSGAWRMTTVDGGPVDAHTVRYAGT